MKIKVLIDVFLYITIFIFIVGMFIFSSVLVFKINNIDYSIIQELGKNWSQGMITDIEVSETPCKGDYENILTDRYQGTRLGCKCNNFPLEIGTCNKIHDEEIDYEVFSKNCFEVPATPPVNYKLWRGYYICAKRDRVSYFKLDTLDPLSKCPKDKPKKCGKLDSLGNIYCVKEKEECPINNIQFANTQSEFDKIKHKKFKLIDKFIYFSNDSEKGKVITNFKVSDGEPCANYHYQNSYHGFTYILNIKYLEQPCTYLVGDTYYDYRYTIIDTYDNINIYIENKVYDLIKDLPEMVPLDFDYDLFSRGFFGVTNKCKKDIRENFKNIDDFVIKLITIDKLFSYSFHISLVIFILVFMLVLSITIGTFNNFNKCLDNRVTFTILSMVFVLGLTILAISFYRKFMGIHYYYNFLMNNCMDSINDFLIDLFNKEIEQIKDISLYLIVFSTMCFMLLISELLSPIWIKYVKKCLCMKLRRKKSKKTKEYSESKKDLVIVEGFSIPNIVQRVKTLEDTEDLRSSDQDFESSDLNSTKGQGPNILLHDHRHSIKNKGKRDSIKKDNLIKRDSIKKDSTKKDSLFKGDKES